MKKRFFSFILTLIFAIPAGLCAQGGDIPHVSGIRAEPRNNLIRLSWVDSPDARGPVYIFRSARPFRNSIPPNSRPVVVRYGEQFYIDETDDIENLYYYIAASDASSGRRIDIILPQINSTNVNLAAASPPVIQGDPPAAAVSVEESPPHGTARSVVQGISNIRARQEGDRVSISFDVSGPRKNAVLYRSMQPLRQPQDLLNAVIVRSRVSSPFIDDPVPGLSWYYAVIFEDEISGGNMGIRPGGNATSSPVMISVERTTERPLRPIPLPAMSGSAVDGNFFLHDAAAGFTPLSGQTKDMIRNSSVPPKAALPLKNPRVFAVDLQAPSGGEESALFQIVKEYFEKRDWEGSRLSLLHYLSLPRSKNVEARARFYLGQSLYFTGNYREALFEFLSIKSVHPVEANLWIDAVLSAMVH